jgi:uncharacterized membrane protein
MDTLFDYTIPVLHPLAVHFPLSLILAGALVAGLWCWRGTPFWRRCALLLFTLGLAGGFFAWFTGEALEEQVDGEQVVALFVELHENMARLTLIVTGLVVGLLGYGTWHLERQPAPAPEPILLRTVVAFLSVVAAALVALTAHIGGVMVWGILR